MSWKQVTFLIGLVVATWGVVWWVSHQSKAPHNYRWFVKELPKQKSVNQQLKRKNQHLRRKVMALRYDQRTIAREIRDQLSLSKKGEVILYLPKK